MKKFVFLICSFLFLQIFCKAQIVATGHEQQLENSASQLDFDIEDDSYLQQLEYFLKHPIRLNSATEKELKELKMLSGLQIASFFSYKKLIGSISSIYELQSIPSWDISTIKKIIPYVIIGEPQLFNFSKSKILSDGQHIFLFRTSQVLEKAKGFNNYPTPGKKYLGSPQKIFLRYRYQMGNELQYGFTGEKDAGEQFFSGNQKTGFDFYSFHFFIRKKKNIRSFALGDFTVNMGQGLIQWQQLSFGKSVVMTSIEKQAATLLPYNSAGEFSFHRGTAITIQKKNTEATAFISYRKLSANFIKDTFSKEEVVSSFLNSGYHRTESEIQDKNKLGQFSFGGTVKYKFGNNHVAINAVQYMFSNTINKNDAPYNLYAINGKDWSNFSLDHNYSFKNIYSFGEIAIDKNFNKAILQGMLFSVDPKLDFSILYRNISKTYQAVGGNAFTENTFPQNEKGLFAGISIRPTNSWKVDAYFDVFQFPWLKYGVDAPSNGKDFFVQLSFNPNKKFEIYTRYKNESKEQNETNNSTATNFLVLIPKLSWRTQWSYQFNSAFSLRNRIEFLWYNTKNANSENGLLTFVDGIFHPFEKKWSSNLRLQYFKTNGYNSRIYAYENDVLFYYSIPAFFDEGFRYYVNINYSLTKNSSVWLKCSQVNYLKKNKICSGLDEISVAKKTEIRVLMRVAL